MEPMNGEDFFLEKKIGEGMFGEVHLARYVRDGSPVAMKRIGKLNQNVNSNIRESFLQEIKSGSLLNHRGIVQTKGFFESSKHFWIVMELIEGEELISFLEKRRYRPLSEEETKKVFGQIVSSVAFAHRRGVAHLDLKLDNILMDSEFKTKIIDWGLSTTEDPKNCTKYCGSPEYAAPEIWRRKSIYNTYDAFLADSFSLGVILFALLFGRFPFNRKALGMMRRGYDVGELQFLDGIEVSEEAKNLCKRLLDVNPETRMRVDELEDQSWLALNEISPATCAS
jgi:serine/threonine protein kinase